MKYINPAAETASDYSSIGQLIWVYMKDREDYTIPNAAYNEAVSQIKSGNTNMKGWSYGKTGYELSWIGKHNPFK